MSLTFIRLGEWLVVVVQPGTVDTDQTILQQIPNWVPSGPAPPTITNNKVFPRLSTQVAILHLNNLHQIRPQLLIIKYTPGSVPN